MKMLVFFNNKGGVGKTTLACNFAHYLSSFKQKKTLVLDLDPQCNSTQLLLHEDEWEEIYKDRSTAAELTILNPLKPIREGDSSVDTANLPIRRSPRFRCSILPGHPALSSLEDRFGTSWVDFKAIDPGGARRTAWLRALRPAIEDAGYEHVIVDVGPSLGAINRSVLIGSDYFVTPTAPDLFSLFALDNIAGWMDLWIGDYKRNASTVRGTLRDLGYIDLIPKDLPIARGFVGYTVQQYVTTTRGGERRKIKAYDQHRDEIPERAAGLISRSEYADDQLDLGTVPNMFSMIPLAQSRHAPIASLGKSDGVLGAQVNQQARYSEQLTGIFSSLFSRIGS